MANVKEGIDTMVYRAAFGSDDEKQKARQEIYAMGLPCGVFPASIQAFYMARGKGEYKGFSVPAINVRVMSYNTARAVFRAANTLNVGALIFEIARSEIGYTDQRPAEFTTSIMAAAIKEGFRGPVFLQGDHYQFKVKKYQEDPAKEIQAIKDLVKESIEAHFYNIDIDASTLVDLSKASISEQQEANFRVTAVITDFIRQIEPRGTTISVGGEIGEVGGKNSNPEELKAFLDGYKKVLAEQGNNRTGLSKVSVQTGTTHGGIMLADGTMAQVKIDFNTLETMSKVCQEYGLGGAVQHGASTLPEEAFDNFPKKGTLEVHLATEFQNMMYDHPQFPNNLKEQMNRYVREHCIEENKSDQTDEQFVYKNRKNAIGPFKKQTWDLSPAIQAAIGDALEKKFMTLFTKLNVANTKDIINAVIVS